MTLQVFRTTGVVNGVWSRVCFAFGQEEQVSKRSKDQSSIGIAMSVYFRYLHARSASI
jgi:hypothetical protein